MKLQDKLVAASGCKIIFNSEGMEDNPAKKAEWLRARKAGINGTDAGKIAGICHWGNAASVYLDKVTPDIPSAPSEPQNWFKLGCGLKLESLIASWYARMTGYTVECVDYMLRHPFIPFIAGDMDYIAETPDGRLIGIEIKTTEELNVLKGEFHAGTLGDDGILPEQYEYQVRHYMAVTGLDVFKVLICYGFDDSKILVVTVNRDEDKEAELLDMEIAFWKEHIETGRRPADVPMRKDDLKRIQKQEFDLGSTEMGDMPDESVALMEEYLALSAEKSEAMAEVGRIEGEQNAVLAEICRMSHGLPMSTRDRDGDTYYEVVNKLGSRTTVDSAKLKELHPDIYEECKNVSTFEQTTVKVKKIKKSLRKGVA